MKVLRLTIATACLAVASTTQAGILFDLVDYGTGVTDKLQDESGSIVRDVGTGNVGSFDVGDVLQGVFAVPSVNNLNVGVNTGGTLLGVFSMQVTSRTALGPNTILEFGAVTAPGLDLASILSGAGISTAGLTSLSSTLGVSDSTFAVLSLPTAGSLFPAGLDGSSATLGLTSSYSVEVLGGFEGDDFYQVSITGAGGAAGPISLPGENEPESFAGFKTAFSVIAGDVPFPVNFIELSTTEFDGTTANGDFIGSGTVSAPVLGTTPTGFGFGDDGTFTFQIVPEATSLLVWGGLSGLFGLVGMRRRK